MPMGSFALVIVCLLYNLFLVAFVHTNTSKNDKAKILFTLVTQLHLNYRDNTIYF